MKTLLKKGALLLVSFLCLYIGYQKPAEARPQGVITFQTFYTELAPYGNWIQNSDYGYAWVPNVSRDFWPYGTSGHWVMTEYGNTWVSDYDWGWAPFHYGRWLLDDYYGWIWVPGTEWAPAWVAWRSGGGYYGWAPLSPGIHINVSFNVGRYVPNNYWVFVNQGYFNRRSIYRYCVPRGNVVNVINHTTIINNTYVDNRRQTYYTGPRANDIERATHQPVRVHRLNQADRPSATVVRNGAVSVYRPQVERSSRDAAPATSYNRNGSKTTPRSGNSYAEGRNRNQIIESSRSTESRTNQSDYGNRNNGVNSGSSRSYSRDSRTGNSVNEKDNTIQRSGNNYSRGSAERDNSSSGNRNNSYRFNQSDNNTGNSGSNYSSGNGQRQMQPPAEKRSEPVRKPAPQQPTRTRSNPDYSNNRSNSSGTRSNQNYSQSRQSTPSRQATPSRQPDVNRSQAPARSQSAPQRESQSQSRSSQSREPSRSRGNH